ncbi:restriction system protein [Gracilibacillus orientalis]|uniref:Restriction system protein n=1 Tax=Gracilibacillus orientalis TaxID=334253 RepID=A0A1I4J5X2_9BACI|nr:restriction endonuclease [Gracilibacillus orientalis]SFL61571.1 restriction system protein [Gracilibacillus orientalis]
MNIFEGFKIGIDLLWSILAAEPLLTLGIILFIALFVIYEIIIKIIKEYRLKRSGIENVDEMSGNKFEEYLILVLKGRGYKVKLTPKTGDYGADLILITNNKKIVVQAKRYKKNVGVRAVQEIVSAQKYYKADECWVITNSLFTNQAIKLAGSNQVRLIDRSELMDWMIEYKKSA